MPTTIESEIDALHRMTTSELAERYAELHGHASRTRHRTYLIRKIAWRIQANAEGDLTERARKRAAELADDADIRVMAPKTMICPPQPTEQATVNRTLPNGEHNDPRIPNPGSAIARRLRAFSRHAPRNPPRHILHRLAPAQVVVRFVKGAFVDVQVTVGEGELLEEPR